MWLNIENWEFPLRVRSWTGVSELQVIATRAGREGREGKEEEGNGSLRGAGRKIESQATL